MEEGGQDNNEIKHERIRVKKRIKIKKKADPKTKFKKIGTYIMWMIVLGLFIYALLTMVKESDMRDKNKNFIAPPIVQNWLHQIMQ